MLPCVCLVIDHIDHMTPKCSKSKKAVHSAIAECVADVLTKSLPHFEVFRTQSNPVQGLSLIEFDFQTYV